MLRCSLGLGIYLESRLWNFWLPQSVWNHDVPQLYSCMCMTMMHEPYSLSTCKAEHPSLKEHLHMCERFGKPWSHVRAQLLGELLAKPYRRLSAGGCVSPTASNRTRSHCETALLRNQTCGCWLRGCVLSALEHTVLGCGALLLWIVLAWLHSLWNIKM